MDNGGSGAGTWAPANPCPRIPIFYVCHLITSDSDLAKLKASLRGQGQTGGRIQTSLSHCPA